MKIRGSVFRRVETNVIAGSILVALFFIISTDGVWLSSLPSVLRVTAQVGIIAIGQALLMTSGEVDLSVGSVFAFTGVVFVWMMDIFGMGMWSGAIVAFLLACCMGLINGLITVNLRVPSMIVTLGAMFVYRGLSYISTQGFSLSVPREFRKDPLAMLVKDSVFGVSYVFLIMLLLTAIFVFIYSYTRFGNHVQAVGGDANAALANGVSPDSVKVRAFVICSGLAGLSGILILAQQGAVYATSGRLLELETIAAAVIGGCALRGGFGSIWGPILGVFILSTLKGGLMMMGAPTSWYIAFVGAILIGFLILGRLLNAQAGRA